MFGEDFLGGCITQRTRSYYLCHWAQAHTGSSRVSVPFLLAFFSLLAGDPWRLRPDLCLLGITQPQVCLLQHWSDVMCVLFSLNHWS